MTNLDDLQHKGLLLAATYGPRLGVTVLIIIAGVVVARGIGKGFLRAIARLKLEPPVSKLLTRIVRWLVIGMFTLVAMQHLGVELLPLLAGLGVAGAGIALAAQGVLSNLMAGLTIIFTKPFRVGEYVAMLGVEGRVESIDLFSTTLSHPDRSLVVVPNRKIVGEILHDYGAIRQLDLRLAVRVDADLSRVIETVHEVLAANAKVLKDPAPFVGVSSLSPPAVGISVMPWVEVPHVQAGGSEIYQAIVARLRTERIELPLPRQDVRVLDRRAA